MMVYIFINLQVGLSNDFEIHQTQTPFPRVHPYLKNAPGKYNDIVYLVFVNNKCCQRAAITYSMNGLSCKTKLS